MNFANGEYKEIAQLGGKKEGETRLMRSSDGDVLVCKKISKELYPVYKKIMEIKCENIIEIYNILKSREYYLVLMEYFPSVNLEEKLSKAGKLSLKEARLIMTGIAKGIKKVHDLGIIHRDLSPANILIGKDNHVKITDFGIAREYDKNKKNDTIILGTCGFAAPEQFGFAQTDEKSDVFAMGALMNMMLTGKLPHEEPYFGDVKIGAMIRKCTSMLPEERYTVEEIIELFGEKIFTKKHIRKKLIRKIPGFRTGNPVYMTLATIYYAYMGFFYLMLVSVGRGGLLHFFVFCIFNLAFGYFAGSFKVVAYKLNMKKGIKKLIFVPTPKS